MDYLTTFAWVFYFKFPTIYHAHKSVKTLLKKDDKWLKQIICIMYLDVLVSQNVTLVALVMVTQTSILSVKVVYINLIDNSGS